MPSGRTHDRITLWSLPLITGSTWIQTRSSTLALLVSGGFLVGGLMFGPDLDIHSRQYQRWGWLRWIWLPYRKCLRHRSFWSHGPVVGTTLRLVYLGLWLSLVVGLGLALAISLGWYPGTPETVISAWGRSLQQYQIEGIALIVGLELGAMSHSLSDWGGSTYKRLQKKGWQGLLKPQRSKPKKRVSKRTPSTAQAKQEAKTPTSRTKRPVRRDRKPKTSAKKS